MFSRPLGQFCFSRWRGINEEKISHKPLNLLTSDQDIAYQLSEQLAGEVTNAWVNRDQGFFLPNNLSYGLNKKFVSEGFGANGVDDRIFGAFSFINGHPSEIVYINRLETILAITEHAKYGKFSQKPGYVVDENVFFAEQDSGAKY